MKKSAERVCKTSPGSSPPVEPQLEGLWLRGGLRPEALIRQDWIPADRTAKPARDAPPPRPHLLLPRHVASNDQHVTPAPFRIHISSASAIHAATAPATTSPPPGRGGHPRAPAPARHGAHRARLAARGAGRVHVR